MTGMLWLLDFASPTNQYGVLKIVRRHGGVCPPFLSENGRTCSGLVGCLVQGVAESRQLRQLSGILSCQLSGSIFTIVEHSKVSLLLHCSH